MAIKQRTARTFRIRIMQALTNIFGKSFVSPAIAAATFITANLPFNAQSQTVSKNVKVEPVAKIKSPVIEKDGYIMFGEGNLRGTGFGKAHSHSAETTGIVFAVCAPEGEFLNIATESLKTIADMCRAHVKNQEHIKVAKLPRNNANTVAVRIYINGSAFFNDEHKDGFFKVSDLEVPELRAIINKYRAHQELIIDKKAEQKAPDSAENFLLNNTP